MSRQFSIPTMLRMVPNELLREFFSVLGHADFDPNWEHLGQREFDPLLDYITDLPTSQAGEFDQELQAVYELSCQSGMTAIAEAAKLLDMAELPLQMPQEMSVHGRAMWTRLRHPKVFETAQLLHEIDHLSWWRKQLENRDLDWLPGARRIVAVAPAFYPVLRGRLSGLQPVQPSPTNSPWCGLAATFPFRIEPIQQRFE